MAKPKKKASYKKPAPRRSYAADSPKDAASDDDAKILEYAQKCLKDCVDEEEDQRNEMRDDMRFCTLDQWPSDIRKERENDVENGPRPCLTIDKINQYVVQVVNDMKQGKPGINVRPQDDTSDPETARILKGLVRNIEDQSNADIAYGTAAENTVKIGLGYFRITTEYASDDSFDQEIFIRPIPNTFSVYLGKHLMPDGSDADRGYIVESMPKEKFRAEFPKAKWTDKDFDAVDSDVKGFWKTGEAITVVEEFVIERTAVQLCFLSDGTTISRADYDAWPASAGAKPTIQDERTTVKKQLKWRKLTAIEVLEKRDLPGKYIPIVEVVGRESFVNGRRILWGLVRPAKDSLRMYNYWASTITEKMALAPKTPWIGAVGQFATQGDRWKKSNRTNYATLEYDNVDTATGNPLPPPQRQGSTPMEAALLKQMQVIEHDVQTSLGMFRAAVGESESQQSGRAILALQRESDTGTYHFGANLGISIRHAGRIIVDLIPHYYDTKRIVRILGEDGLPQTAHIDPQQEVAHREIQSPEGIKHIYNPGVGKYDVSITVGPSYNTKRMEAAATFVELAKGATDPASAAILRYLTIRNSDFNGADEAAKMLRAMLPPQALESLGGQPEIPPQARAQMQQMSQQIAMMHEAGNKLAQENQALKAKRDQAIAELQLKREVAMEEIRIEREVATEKAKLARDIAESEHGLAQHKVRLEQDEKLQARVKEEEAPLLQNALPQFMTGMQQMLETFTAASQGQQQALMQMAQAITAERTSEVDLGDGRKLRATSKTGAPVTVQ